MRDYWGKPEFLPLWWPAAIKFRELKSKSLKDLLVVIQAYKDYQYPEGDKVASAPDRDRSPLTTRRFVQESKSETSIDDVLQPTSIQGKHTHNFYNQTSDIDTSNDSFFPSDTRQPDFTSLPDHSGTLATLKCKTNITHLLICQHY